MAPATARSQTQKVIALPPYGLLPAGFGASKEAPRNWRFTQAEFETWLDGSVALLRDLLWPADDPKRQVELTKTDLKLLLEIRALQPLEQLPDSPLRHPKCLRHRDFFSFEDGQGPTPTHEPGELHRHYDRTLDKELLIDPFARLFALGHRRKAPGSLIFWIKKELQRPRPYQTAQIIPGFQGFTYESAHSGPHPAMISGHGIQGAMGGAGIIERLLLDKIPISEESRTAIQQFSVDFGDRRVMAGVHYPSDNLSSWLLALDLCKRVCDERVAVQAKQSLWTAISTRSIVYKWVKGAIGSDKSHPYRPAWDELHKRGKS